MTSLWQKIWCPHPCDSNGVVGCTSWALMNTNVEFNIQLVHIAADQQIEPSETHQEQHMHMAIPRNKHTRI